ncbi:MAG: nucleotidyltransferase family protein [Thermodesulfovibrionales bacterium]|nr:nucleotidyltransferase family protein [Thermodesulfovibrionales bacterium]
MKTLNEIREILKGNKPALKEQFGVSQLGLFGSYARGEQDPKSDLDVLVDFDEPVDLFQFMDLNDQLEKLTGMKVDLVTRGALKPHIGKRILSEVSYL